MLFYVIFTMYSFIKYITYLIDFILKMILYKKNEIIIIFHG